MVVASKECPVLQLICHHTYKLPPGAVGSSPPYVAIDLSRFENHGSAEDTQFDPDGAAPSSGAMLFQRNTSVVKIRPSPSFEEIGQLRVETQIRLDAVPTTRMNLVEGHMSFSFFIAPGGILTGTFFGPLTPGAPPTWFGVDSGPNFSPDGATHAVPVGNWTTLSYTHDGLRWIEIAIDGVVVGRRGDIISGVVPVGPYGTTVGSWPDDRRYTLQGAVDDLKIWRRDPDAMANEFFSRPFGEREGACWARLFVAIRDRLGQRDDVLLQFLQQIRLLMEDGLRRAANNQEFIARNHDFAEQFHKLWRGGGLASDDMRGLLRAWIPEAMQVTGINPSNQNFSRAIAHLVDSELTRQFRDFDCDPAFAKFLGFIQEQVGNP